MNDLALHDYQVVAREFLTGRHRAALFLDMGLGKTAIALDALTDEHLPALVVAPKRVAENVWNVERDKWRPDLSLVRAVGSKDERADALRSDAAIHVIGRDNLRDVRADHRYRTVILDELSGFKNRSSVRWRAAKRLTVDPDIAVWGLTGTPAPNGYLDLWGQIALLDGGHRLGKNLTTYRGRYFRPGRQLASGTIVSWDIREGSEDHIKALLQDICLSMESDGRVELPAFTVNTVDVRLPSAARKIYNDMQKDMVAVLGDDIDVIAGSAAAVSGKLAQITAGFLYDEDSDYTPIHLEKIHAVEEICAEAQGSPVLVFYGYVAEREMLAQAITGAETIDAPNAVARWNRNEVPVLLAHPASAGHGLNLQDGGHTIVWTTPPWDLEHWEQGNKRLHRQGQRHPVVAHVLCVPGSVDDLRRDRLAGKADVQQDLLRYLRSPI